VQLVDTSGLQRLFIIIIIIIINSLFQEQTHI